MSTTTPGPYSPVSDLETTADYPPASPMAPTDTWVMASRAKEGAPEDPLRAYHEEIRTLRQSVAGVTLVRDQLQAELAALTAKRHELEEQLLTREALLSKHEQQLAERQEQITALSASLAAITVSRDKLQAELSALAKPSQDPGADEELLRENQRELALRDLRVTQLSEELATRAQQHFLVAAERDDLQARLERARTDLSNIAQKRDRKTSAQAEAEREHALRAAALARSRDDLTELQRRVARNREALQRAETRRQVFDAMLRDREEMIDERDARVGALQAELEEQRRDHATALERANAQLAAAIARAGGAERQFGQQLPGAPAHDTVPTAPTPDAQPRLAALETELAELNGTLRSLSEQLQAERDSNATLRHDLASAERRLHEASHELKQSNERGARLEAEAVAAKPLLLTGQRLLVRTEGDAGIVHVLGRRTTIGRTPANDLCIDAESISRHHAVVLATDTSTVVEDLNSTNGVFVNDVRVTRHELRAGDIVTIGKASFRYVLKPEPGQT